MNERLNKRRIIKNRAVDGASKKETESLFNMRQRFSEKKIKIILKLQEQYKIEHSWTCKCGKVNEDLIFNCPFCGGRKVLNK